MQTRKAAQENVDHIGDHRASARRHNPDARGESRQRPLARRLEEAFGSQLLLELLKGELQRAMPLQLESLHLQLVLAAHFVNVDSPARQYGRAILRLELEVARGGPEADATQLRVRVFQREIVVTARSQLCAGDLARHPDVGKLLIEQVANRRIQLGDGKRAPLRTELQDKLFHWGR